MSEALATALEEKGGSLHPGLPGVLHKLTPFREARLTLIHLAGEIGGGIADSVSHGSSCCMVVRLIRAQHGTAITRAFDGRRQT